MAHLTKGNLTALRILDRTVEDETLSTICWRVV